MASNTVTIVLKTLCTLSLLFLHLSPIPTMRRFIREKHTGEKPLLPMVLMFYNFYTCRSFLRTLHGLFMDDIFPVASTMSVGIVAGLIYSAIFVRYTPDRASAWKICLGAFAYFALVTVFVVLSWSGVLYQSNDTMGHVFGGLGMMTSFVFYSSPFATIRLVLRTKSAESLIMLMCVVATLNNLFWALYAVVASDTFLLVPNSICFCFGLLQILLCIKYHPAKLKNKNDDDALAISIGRSPKQHAEDAVGGHEYQAVLSPLAAIEGTSHRQLTSNDIL